MKTRIIALILVAILALSFAACDGNTADTSSTADTQSSGASTDESKTESKDKTLACTVDELLTAINGVNYEEDLFPYDADRLLDDVAIKAEDYKEGFLATGIGAYVENVAFFVCENKDQATRMEALLNSFVKDIQMKEEHYNADNFQIAKDAVVTVEGNYVYMVMSRNLTEITKAITDNLK